MNKLLFRVRVDGSAATVTERYGRLISGMTGVSVAVSYDGNWRNMRKTAVFRNGKITRDVVDVGEVIEIPPDVLASAGALEIGMYGWDQDNGITLPTAWASLDVIRQGADPSGDESTDATLPVWAQLFRHVETELRKAKQSGEFDGEDGVSPTHKWNGTILTVKSAAGVSSADLKGDKGDKGDTGEQGPQGEKGDTGEQGPKGEPGEVNIDNTKIGEDAWSSKNTVDKLCPAFTESGPVVTCEPVEGYPLGVVSRIEHIQEGSGTPSPDNVRPIVARTGVTLTHSNEAETNTLTIDFGQGVYGGSLNWATGVLTIDRKMVTLDGTEVWQSASTGTTGVLRYRLVKGVNPILLDNIKLTANDIFPSDNLMCSKLPTVSANAGWLGKTDGIYAEGHYVINVVHKEYAPDVESLKEMMKGAQIAFGLEVPITIQLAQQEILALSGVNSLYSDTGNTEVAGRADPVAIINKLTNAIISLGGNV